MLEWGVGCLALICTRNAPERFTGPAVFPTQGGDVLFVNVLVARASKLLTCSQHWTSLRLAMLKVWQLSAEADQVALLCYQPPLTPVLLCYCSLKHWILNHFLHLQNLNVTFLLFFFFFLSPLYNCVRRTPGKRQEKDAWFTICYRENWYGGWWGWNCFWLLTFILVVH